MKQLKRCIYGLWNRSFQDYDDAQESRPTQISCEWVVFSAYEMHCQEVWEGTHSTNPVHLHPKKIPPRWQIAPTVAFAKLLFLSLVDCKAINDHEDLNLSVLMSFSKIILKSSSQVFCQELDSSSECRKVNDTASMVWSWDACISGGASPFTHTRSWQSLTKFVRFCLQISLH